MKNTEIFDTLFNLAVTTPKVGHAKIVSIITRKNKMIAFGANEMKSHPFQKRFSKDDNCIFLHSEINAIKNSLRILKVDELSSCNLYVCRVKQTQRWQPFTTALSKPCKGCQKAISVFGLNTFYTKDGIDEFFRL